MIREFAKVGPDGEILARAWLDETEVADPANLAAHKPRWLPIERDAAPTYSAETQVLLGPTETIENDRLHVAYSIRAKTGDEVSAMKATKAEAIKAEFLGRAYAPLDHAVAGVSHSFDGDKDAIENLTGVTTLINAGALTTPRSWKTCDGLVTLAPSDFMGLVGALAARKDALYQAKWTLEAQLAGLSTAAAVAAFDPSAGWGA